MRIKIRKRKPGDDDLKLLIFDPTWETIPSLMNLMRQKLGLDNKHNIVHLIRGGIIEEINEIQDDD